MENQRVSQKLFDELTMLASSEDACITLIGFLHEIDLPEEDPLFVAVREVHNKVMERMDLLVDFPWSDDLPF